MKTIIHIGSPKTGTTSIQKMMAASRRRLLEKGILYPEIGHNPINHAALTTGIFVDQALPRLIRYYLDKNKIDKSDYYDQQVESIREQLAYEDPEELVLSTELLFGDLKNIDYNRLISDLSINKEDVDILIYIRNPADYYLSLTQQHLKHASYVQPPAPNKFRRVIQSHEEAFSKKVHVRAFDRNVLVGGDVRLDFCSAIGVDSEQMDCSSGESNSTLSAEVMWLSQNYRNFYFPKNENEPIKAHDMFLRKIKRAERELDGFNKPRLRKAIRSLILQKSRDDILWLEKYIGYALNWCTPDDAVEAPETLEPPLGVSDICEVDFTSALKTLYHALDLPVQK